MTPSGPGPHASEPVRVDETAREPGDSGGGSGPEGVKFRREYESARARILKWSGKEPGIVFFGGEMGLQLVQEVSVAVCYCMTTMSPGSISEDIVAQYLGAKKARHVAWLDGMIVLPFEPEKW